MGVGGGWVVDWRVWGDGEEESVWKVEAGRRG